MSQHHAPLPAYLEIDSSTLDQNQNTSSSRSIAAYSWPTVFSFSGSSRNVWKALDVHGLERGSDRQVHLVNLRQKVSRGGAEARRNIKKSTNHAEPFQGFPPRSSLVFRASALNFFAAVSTAEGQCNASFSRWAKSPISDQQDFKTRTRQRWTAIRNQGHWLYLHEETDD